LLQERYPDRYQMLEALSAWRLLLATPRHYLDTGTVCSADGRRAVPLPPLHRGPSAG
jgi:hypothetical protein